MAKLVDIQGRFPCEPDNKKPTLIKNGSIQQHYIHQTMHLLLTILLH